MGTFDADKHTMGLPQTRQGIRRGFNELGIYVMKVHYTADPEKRSEEWIAAARKGVPDRDWDQEMEMVPVPISGKPVYGAQYRVERHELPAPHEWRPEWPSFGVWDFGYHRPCFSLFQEDPDERAIWFKSTMGEDQQTDEFYYENVRPLLQEYQAFQFRHFCDPAGKATRSTGRSDLDVLADYKIHPLYCEEPELRDIINGVKIVEKMLIGRTEKNVPPEKWVPTLMVDPFNNPLGVETLSLGYRYPEKIDDREESPLPLKDGYYDNPADTVRYYAVNRQPILLRARKKREHISKAKRTYQPAMRAGGYRGY